MGGGRGVKSSVQFFFISTSVCILFMILCHLNYYCSRCKIYPYNRLHCWKQLKGSVLYRNYFSYKKKKLKKTRTNKQIQQTYVWKNYPIEVLLYRRNKICCIKTDVKYGYTETDYVGYNFGPKSVLENYL